MRGYTPFGDAWFTRHLQVLWWFVVDPPFYDTAFADYEVSLRARYITIPEHLLIQ